MKECDLILKGGITSGVVYPEAISRIAKDHRFRNIAGTSAGAIAAIFAAAAEYRRAEGDGEAGFDEVSATGKALGTKLKFLFQPDPKFSPLFNLFMLMLDKKNIN